MSPWTNLAAPDGKGADPEGLEPQKKIHRHETGLAISPWDSAWRSLSLWQV